MFEVAKLRTMLNKLEKDTFEGKEGKWITLENGQHIFIREGESLDGALGRLKPSEEAGKELEQFLEFHNSNSIQETKIKDAMSKLPVEDVKGFKRIYIRERLDLGYDATFKRDVDGSSSMYIARETLEGEDWKEFSSLVISHEVGHSVFERRLDKDQVSDWRVFFYDNKDIFPTEYSKINPSEGFAESYGRYQTKSGWRKLDPTIKSKLKEYGVKKK